MLISSVSCEMISSRSADALGALSAPGALVASLASSLLDDAEPEADADAEADVEAAAEADGVPCRPAEPCCRLRAGVFCMTVGTIQSRPQR